MLQVTFSFGKCNKDMSYKIRHVVKIKDLPSTWFVWLHVHCGFSTSKDVTVETETGRKHVHTTGIADDGSRAFCVSINDAANANPIGSLPQLVRVAWGGWGGPNPYEQHSDIEGVDWPIPWDGCIIAGQTAAGYGKMPHISIHVSEYTFVRMFATDNPGWMVVQDSLEENGGDPTLHTMKLLENIIGEIFFASDPLTPIERQVMYCYGCIKSGKYRQDELAKVADQDAITQTIASLFLKKYLKASKSGAISMTIEGKNTRKAMAGTGRW
jgi:hypothetical protein